MQEDKQSDKSVMLSTLYYKGKIQNRLLQQGDSVLTLEQILRNENEWNAKALYYIVKIRVKQKNFYEAYHTLNRLPKSLENQKISDFRKLTEGVMRWFANLYRSYF